MAKFSRKKITPQLRKLLKGTNVEKYVYDNMDGKDDDTEIQDKEDVLDENHEDTQESEDSTADENCKEPEDLEGSGKLDGEESIATDTVEAQEPVDFKSMRKQELMDYLDYDETKNGKITVKDLLKMTEV